MEQCPSVSQRRATTKPRETLLFHNNARGAKASHTHHDPQRKPTILQHPQPYTCLLGQFIIQNHLHTERWPEKKYALEILLLLLFSFSVCSAPLSHYPTTNTVFFTLVTTLAKAFNTHTHSFLASSFFTSPLYIYNLPTQTDNNTMSKKGDGGSGGGGGDGGITSLGGTGRRPGRNYANVSLDVYMYSSLSLFSILHVGGQGA